MKKLSKNFLYIIFIGLVTLGIAGGIILALGKNNTWFQSDSQDTEKIQEKENLSDESNSSTASKSDFSHSASYTGGNSGEYYFIKSFSYSKEVDFDRVEIEFLPRGDVQNIPYYTLKRENSFVSITFSDTVDFDINQGRSTFEGEKQQNIDNGWIVQEIALNYPKDDSMIKVDIDCIGADFGYRIREENLKLIIDLK